MTRNSKIISSHFNWHSKTKKKERKKCLRSVYVTKVRQNFTSNFLDSKKTDLNISTRSISEILTLFKKLAVMYNLNLEIHSGWSLQQYTTNSTSSLIIEWGTYIIILKVKSCLSLPKCLRYSQSTGHIPQVNKYMSLLHRWIAKPHRFSSV